MVNISDVISIERVVKSYGRAEELALKGVSFVVPRGSILGLLGPNGAGKTTLISIICGLIKPDAGSVRVLNGNPVSPAVKAKIGLVPQEVALYPSLTGFENLCFLGAMYGIPTKKLKPLVINYLELFGLRKDAFKLVHACSGGMKRRLNLIAALLHDPEILILDEPTVGVDVVSKSIILEQLLLLKHRGKTLLYTSHQLEEAERICDKIVLLNKGDIVRSDKNLPKENLESLFRNLESANL